MANKKLTHRVGGHNSALNRIDLAAVAAEEGKPLAQLKEEIYADYLQRWRLAQSSYSPRTFQFNFKLRGEPEADEVEIEARSLTDAVVCFSKVSGQKKK